MTEFGFCNTQKSDNLTSHKRDLQGVKLLLYVSVAHITHNISFQLNGFSIVSGTVHWPKFEQHKQSRSCWLQ